MAELQVAVHMHVPAHKFTSAVKVNSVNKKIGEEFSAARTALASERLEQYETEEELSQAFEQQPPPATHATLA